MTLGGTFSFARLPLLRPVTQWRARGPWYTAPLSPTKGRTYTEIDGGVEGHAGGIGNWVVSPRPSNRRSQWQLIAGTQARPVDTYSSHSAEIRRRDGFTVFVCKKDAQHNALRVFWLGTITPRPNRVQSKASLSNSLARGSRSGEGFFPM